VLNSANQRFGAQNDPIYSDPVLYFEISAMYALIWIFVAITFFYLAFIFVARYAILTFLYVLSPLAFVCKVFPIPAAQKIWSSWWENFIKWSFIGIEGAFFLWLSASLLLSKINESSALQVPDLLVIILFLFIGIKFTTKTSAMGASAVIGMAGGAAGFAMGATGKLAKFGAGATGLSRAGNAISDKATAFGERLGLVSRGTTANRQQARLDEARKRVSHLPEADLVALSKKRFGGFTAEERLNVAAATEALMKKGKGHLLGNKLETSLGRAKAFGANVGEMSKGEYRVAGMDQKAINRLMDTRGLTRSQAQFELESQHIEDNIHTYTGEQRRNIAPEHLTPELLTGKSMTINIVKSFRTAEDSQIGKFGDRIAHALDPILDAKFTTDIAAAAGDPREQKRLRDIRSEILKLLS